MLPTPLLLVPFVGLLALARPGSAQELTGRVLDDESGAPLPFVHVGVAGKNLGTVSDEAGRFAIAVEDAADVDDELVLSRPGYAPQRLGLREAANARPLLVRLLPTPVAAARATARGRSGAAGADRIKTLGSKRVAEGDACSVPGLGSELGRAIRVGGHRYRLRAVNFLLSPVTYDSILFRINVYPVAEGEPGASLLGREVFVRAVAGQTWVRRDFSAEGLVLDRDAVVSIEAVWGWSSRKGGRNVCFAIGTGGAPEVYVRRSAMDAWRVDAYPTAMLTVDTEKIKG